MQTKLSTMMPSMPTSQQDPISMFWHDLQNRLGERTIQHWFRGKTTLRVEGNLVQLGVASPFLLAWMQKQFQADVARSATIAWGDAVQTQFIVHGQSLLTPRQTALAPSIVRYDLNHAECENDVKRIGHDVADSARKLTLPLPTSELSTRGISTPRPEPSPVRIAPIVGEILPVDNDAAHPAVSRKGESAAQVRGFHLRRVQNAARKVMELDEFVVGESNELAWTAINQIARAPGQLYHALYVYGGVGIGKTHLLHGLARELRRQHPGLQVLLLSAENFANAFTQGLREKSLPGFRQKFRSIDVLLVDDVDFLDHKKVIQEEFLHTIKHLENMGKQIVLASDRHPRLLGHLSEELITRFLSGVVCRVESPDADTRRQIVLRKAERLQLEWQPEVGDYIAQRFQVSVRELEGALYSLQAVQSLTGHRITLSTAKKVLAEIEKDNARVVRLADIEQVVCRFFDIPEDDLKSARRNRRVSQPRMLAMFLARKLTTAPYSEIGRYFGGRNHSTVVSAEQRVQDWLDEHKSCDISSQRCNWAEIIENLQQQLSA